MNKSLMISPADIIEITDYTKSEENRVKISLNTLEYRVELDCPVSIVHEWAKHDNQLVDSDGEDLSFDAYMILYFDWNCSLELAKFAIRYYSETCIKSVI